MKINGSQHEHERIKKSLRFSVLDGSFHAAMLGFGESYFSAFAVFLKANNIHLALLSSLPLLIGSIAQLLSNAVLSLLKSRKSLVTSAAFLQAMVYVPITLTFFWENGGVNMLIICVSIYWIFGMILSPAWNSWMGDLVEKKTGRLFRQKKQGNGISPVLCDITGRVDPAPFYRRAHNPV